MENRISREEVIRIYKIELHFFDAIVQAGLLATVTEDDSVFVVYEELEKLEKFITWHYDLEVNMPGLEIIHQLLERIDKLQKELRTIQMSV